MDREKLELIIKNLESLVECLKSEVYSDTNSYKQDLRYEEVSPYIDDYDEIFYDEDVDDDLFKAVNQKYKITNDNNGDGL